MRKVLELIKLLPFILSVLLFAFGECQAREENSLPAWKIERSKAISDDNRRNYAKALQSFQRALAFLPASALSDRVDLQCQIAIEYLRLHEQTKEHQIIDEMLANAQKLQGRQALNADNEMSIRALMDEVENSIRGKQLNIKNWTEKITLDDKICSVALPNANSYTRYIEDSRGYLALGAQALALKCAENYFRRMTPKSENYFDFKIRIAALKNFLKQPAMLMAIKHDLLKVKTPAAVAAEIAQAQTWATDYVGCDQSVVEAMKKAKQSKVKQDEILLLYLAQMANFLDCGNWVKGEQLARAVLAMQISEKLRVRFTDKLAECLARQGKNREAALLRNKVRQQYDFLADDERQAAEESRLRRQRFK